jgi:hypothetical protein
VKKFYLVNLKRAGAVSLVYGLAVLVLKWLKYDHIKRLYLMRKMRGKAR